MEGFSLLEVLGRGRLVEEEITSVYFVSALTAENHFEAARFDLPRQDVHWHTCAHLQQEGPIRIDLRTTPTALYGEHQRAASTHPDRKRLSAKA